MFNMPSWLKLSRKDEEPMPSTGGEQPNSGLGVQFIGMSRAVAAAVREVNAKEASEYLKKMKEEPVTNNEGSLIK